MTDDVDLLKGIIRMHIIYRLHRTPSKEEVTELAKEWNKTPTMPFKEFVKRMGAKL